MKIAIATDDFVTVTGHVGRCKGFLVVDVEDGKINSMEKRENNFTHHKIGDGHSHMQSHGHSHSNLLEGLHDCSHLICTAAGWRLQNDIESSGKKVIFTNEINAESAAIKLENGSLEIKEDGVCRSH